MIDGAWILELLITKCRIVSTISLIGKVVDEHQGCGSSVESEIHEVLD